MALNPTKMEMIWFDSHANLQKIATVDQSLRIDCDIMHSVATPLHYLSKLLGFSVCLFFHMWDSMPGSETSYCICDCVYLCVYVCLSVATVKRGAVFMTVCLWCMCLCVCLCHLFVGMSVYMCVMLNSGWYQIFVCYNDSDHYCRCWCWRVSFIVAYVSLGCCHYRTHRLSVYLYVCSLLLSCLSFLYYPH